MGRERQLGRSIRKSKQEVGARPRDIPAAALMSVWRSQGFHYPETQEGAAPPLGGSGRGQWCGGVRGVKQRWLFMLL